MDKTTGIIIIILNIAGLCFIAAMFIITMIKKKINKPGRDANYSPANKKPGKRQFDYKDIDLKKDDDLFDDMDLTDFDDLDLDDLD